MWILLNLSKYSNGSPTEKWLFGMRSIAGNTFISRHSRLTRKAQKRKPLVYCLVLLSYSRPTQNLLRSRVRIVLSSMNMNLILHLPLHLNLARTKNFLYYPYRRCLWRNLDFLNYREGQNNTTQG